MKKILAALAIAAFVAVPAAQPADAASKRQEKVTVCHFDVDEGVYVKIRIAERAWDRAHSKHPNDVLLEDPSADCPEPPVA